MPSRTQLAAWVGLCGVILTGCYSSEVVKPNGEEKESLSSAEMEWVVLTDGSRFDFPTPPTFGEDSIRWKAYQSVSIPLADVTYKHVVEPKKGEGSAQRTLVVVTKDSVRHAFETLPELSPEKEIVGNQAIVHCIPLSDVAEASVKKLPVGWKIVYGVVGVAAVVLIIELAEHPIDIDVRVPSQ
jgi:hypothetical protein